MNRITKDIASSVATQLLLSKTQKVNEIKSEEKKYIRSIFLKTIPEAVMSCFESNPNYIRTTSSIYINGPGLPAGYKSYSLGEYLPSIQGDRITIVEKEAKVITKYEDNIDALQKEIQQLRESIEVTLYNLRTYNNVEKEFPEAFKLLPNSTANTSLMVNVKDLRCKLGVLAC